MKKLFFFSMLFLASIVSHAQTTSYGGLIDATGDSGQEGVECTFYGSKTGIAADNVIKARASTFIGYEAGMNSDSPTGVNTFVGWKAGRETTTGYKNTFVGAVAGGDNEGGRENTFIGAAAGGDNVGGYWNVFVGAAAGRLSNGGAAHHNTYIGYQAGFSNLEGANNVFLGNKAGYNELGSNLLYIDNSDTDTPLIYGDFADDILGLNAHVGIGTHTPESVLNIVADNPAITLTNTNGATLQLASAQAAGNYSPFSNDGDQVIRMLGSDNIIFSTSAIEGSNRNFKFASHDSLLMVINDTGKVSIGDVPQTNGNFKLYVKDGILTEKVRVALCPDWPDYVFEEDYDRSSTEEVEEFIKTNKHLPNVPSAKEVGENGIDMAEMDATLLRQIEELWLNVIDLKKENEVLKSEVENLRK